ncbi:anti-anti-sigma factor [Georgenia muralis]|uniref:Anti-anti-sigma factor n=1 Tax=Georgenia muralis TaxID=154117 RepID=A0A3N4ZZR3_9MICO|nr:anti-anti-sigma factor [Georgenia muralis]
MPETLPVGDRGSVAVLTSPTRTRLVLAGELDISHNRELREAVRSVLALDLPVDVDMRNLTFMDSSALAAFSRLAYRSSARPRLIQPPDVVVFLLEVTAMGDVVEVLDHDPGFPGGPEAGDGTLSADDVPADEVPAHDVPEDDVATDAV